MNLEPYQTPGLADIRPRFWERGSIGLRERESTKSIVAPVESMARQSLRRRPLTRT